MTTAQAATKFSVSASTIRRWCRTGRLTATKIARRWIITLTPAATPSTTPTPAQDVTGQARPSLWESWMLRRRGY